MVLLWFKGSMYQLVLASLSPRRFKLLSEAGYKVDTAPVKVSENIDENLNPRSVVMSLAMQKAVSCFETNPQWKNDRKVIVAADTLVFLDESPLGKPENEQDAIQILKRLSGTEHQVLTGVCFIDTYNQSFVLDYDLSRVFFKKLSEQDILDYVKTGEPMDKAGAYGIQGEAKKFVARNEGSLTNIIGLPMEVFKKVVLENGWKFN